MKFGPEPTAVCAGAILAHGYRITGVISLKKGHVLEDTDIAKLLDASIDEITVARLERGDIGEDEGARRIAKAAMGTNIIASPATTGRVNIYAETQGLIVYDQLRLTAVNKVTEAATLAALSPYSRVAKGQLIATAKIIPFGLAENFIAQIGALASKHQPLFSVAPFRARSIGLVQTELPFATGKLLDKTRDVLARRAAALGSKIIAERRVEHAITAVAHSVTELIALGCDLILVVGASATTDRRDVVPAGVIAAGGRIVYFGMPVDPGNLTVICDCQEVPVLGLPGSARSPRRGGNDLILERIAANLDVGAADIATLGAGGLLKEIPTRPQPREAGAQIAPRKPVQKTKKTSTIAAILLAAGQSRRMGEQNKLLSEISERPMISYATTALREAGCKPIIVVLGHQADEVQAALADQDVIFTMNHDYASGIASSLATGIAALPDESSGVLIALGDMPRLTANHIGRLIAAFEQSEDETICVPVWRGKQGNPVLWDRTYFDEMADLDGDAGAKHLIGTHASFVQKVEMPDDAILMDIDTPEELRASNSPPNLK